MSNIWFNTSMTYCNGTDSRLFGPATYLMPYDQYLCYFFKITVAFLVDYDRIKICTAKQFV